MRLTMRERAVVTKAHCEQYRKSRKRRKGVILDEFVEATGYNRSYARFVLRNHGRRVEVRPGIVLEGDRRVRRRRRRPGRSAKYGPDVVGVLKKVWKIMDYICGKRLAAAIPQAVSNLCECKELRITKGVKAKLLRMSAATIDRLLKPERAKYTLKRRGGTKPGTLLKRDIAIRTFSDWDDATPGFFEMDLVGHDGGSTRGDYCQTLDMTDVATGWSEQAAVRNKAQMWVFEAIQAVRQRLPFSLLGLDSDNGSEFINDELKRYCKQERIAFTRSRPYRKNDTCYVEQKNWSIVRRFVGYGRYEEEKSVSVLNELYSLLRDYNNFFQPSLKLKEKVRDGAHVTRRYHPAKTPYARVLESDHITQDVKDRLTAYYQTLNIAELKRRIETIQNKLLALAVRRPEKNDSAKDEFTALVPKRREDRGGNPRPCPSPRPLGRRSGRTPAEPYPPPRPTRSYTPCGAQSRAKTSKTLE
jgi:hypothetical protein